MAAFLAEHVGSRTLSLLGGLGIALGASAIECERAAPPPPRLERITCKQAVAPEPAPRIYVSIDPESAYRDRVETVALLTVAEQRPTWELHLAPSESGGEALPGHELQASARIDKTTKRSVRCSARVDVPGKLAVSGSAAVDFGDGAREAATNACITSVVEEVIERALTKL